RNLDLHGLLLPRGANLDGAERSKISHCMARAEAPQRATRPVLEPDARPRRQIAQIHPGPCQSLMKAALRTDSRLAPLPRERGRNVTSSVCAGGGGVRKSTSNGRRGVLPAVSPSRLSTCN